MNISLKKKKQTNKHELGENLCQENTKKTPIKKLNKTKHRNFKLIM